MSGTWLRSRILRFTLQQCRRLEQPDAAVQHEREKQRQHEREHEAPRRATVDPNSTIARLFGLNMLAAKPAVAVDEIRS